MESYDKFAKKSGIITMIAIALFVFGPNLLDKIKEANDTKNFKTYYSYYDAVGNKVIINLNKDGSGIESGSGTIRMEYAKTSSGLEQYLSKEPIPCSWSNYTALGYLAIYSRQGEIFIKDGWAYFDQWDMEAKDKHRGCKLN